MAPKNRFTYTITWAAGLCSLVFAIATNADAGQANSDTYEEVYLNLDAETEKLGGALYGSHCASCHDGNVVRAPQRYILQQGSPETILTAMTDGPMREVARELSLEEKTAIAEFITLRKIDQRDVTLAGVACEGARAGFDLDQPVVFEHWGLERGGSHFIPSSVASVRAKDLDTLVLDWAFAYPAANRARSQPAIGGGALFVGSQSGLVYAFDLETGCTRWQFKAAAEVRNAVTLEPWTRGDSEADPLVFFGDLSGNQYAVSALTGELRWRKRMDDHGATTLTAAAELSDGVLYVAVSSLEEGAAIAADYQCCTFRGSIVALDAHTGQELWRRHFVPEATQTGENDAGTPLYGPSGVPIWAGMAMDA
ncbi:MAG: PQQ-binding-like beta-propeller repeat protein, partial [Halieaceae bacterium]